jgi:DNA-binding response OmpR family regulator
MYLLDTKLTFRVTVMRLLAIEDEPELGELLVNNLGKVGIAVDLAATLEIAREYLAVCRYDLILLDLRLPDGKGLELLQKLRSLQDETPVIVVSAADSVQDRISGLREGADDYLVKPFAIDELGARISAVLRRPGRTLGLTLSVGNVTFHSVRREVEIDGRPIVLPRRELAALESLMRADGRVVTRDSLEEAMYALDDDRQSNVLEASLSRLRRRLETEEADLSIRVVRGVGYRLELLAQAGGAA